MATGQIRGASASADRATRPTDQAPATEVHRDRDPKTGNERAAA